MDKRAFFAFLLCLVVLIFWQKFFHQPSTQEQQPDVVKEEKIESNREGKFSFDEAEITPNKENIVIDQSFFSATFSTKGAALISFKLKEYKTSVGSDAKPVEMIRPRSTPVYPFALYSPDPNWKDVSGLKFKVVEQNKNFLVFEYRDSKREITKRFQFFPDRYDFEIKTTIKSFGTHPLPHQIGYLISETKVEEEKGGIFNPGASPGRLDYFVDDEVEKVTLEKFYESEPISVRKPISWAVFNTKYFVLGLVPTEEKNAEFIAEPITGKDMFVAAHFVYSSPGEQEISFSSSGYIGPKLVSHLSKVNDSFDKVVDWGWFKVFSVPLLVLLNFFYKLIHNYGVAIILLTILVKLLLFPFAHKSHVSMKEMQRIQPQIQQIKEKYKDDKERLNREMVNLMKTNKVNPMGGCLPLLFQMPVFFALYRVLYNSVELLHAPFFGWIKDLSARDPYFVTPIIMSLLMVVQQMTTPSSMDPAQKRAMMFMPVMFGFLMLFLPAGLNLYLLVNSILTIAQQYITNRALTTPKKIEMAS